MYDSWLGYLAVPVCVLHTLLLIQAPGRKQMTAECLGPVLHVEDPDGILGS